MAASHMFETPPPMWWVSAEPAPVVRGSKSQPSGDAWGGDLLHLGDQSCRLTDIAGYEIARSDVRDNDGLMLAGGFFLFCGLVFLVGVLSFGAAAKFLIGAAFFGFFSIASLYEAYQIKPVSYYTLDVDLMDGSRLPFTTADPDDLARLIGVLNEALDGADGVMAGADAYASAA